MGKHTPGPWSVPHFAQPDVDCHCGYVLTDQMMGAVCTVHVSGEGDDWKKHGDNPRFKEACANARLIAAAPEMLAALQAFIAYDASDPTSGVDMMLDYVEALDLAKAAIAKAGA